MRFYFFASFIVFCIWLGYEIHKHRNMEAKDYEAFWDREHAANSTRRKSLDGLPYIAIPVETFPFGLLPGNEQVPEYAQRTDLLCKWKEKEGQPAAARILLEFAADTHTDIYASYELLVRIYEENSEKEKISSLLPLAQEIRSLSKNRIITLLEEHR